MVYIYSGNEDILIVSKSFQRDMYNFVVYYNLILQKEASNTVFYRTVYFVAIDVAYVTTCSGLIYIELLSSSIKNYNSYGNNLWYCYIYIYIYIYIYTLKLKYDTSSFNFKCMSKVCHIIKVITILN
jgi:hypothetical protein